MNPFLKLSIKIERCFVLINQALPTPAWYAILLITILGNIFFAGYFGPEIFGAFAFLWCFSLIIVIFGAPDSSKSSRDSYIGLFFGTFLFLVFIVLLITSVVPYL